MARGWVLLLCVLLVSVGCLGTTQDEAANLEGTDHQGPEDRSGPEDPTAAPSTTGQPAASSNTLVDPPTWEVGEWWEIRLTSPLGDQEVTFTRVVAGLEGEDYLIGQPRDAWSKEAVLFHTPGLGEVAPEDLSYEVHDVRFHPLAFPLTDGKEWETAFEGAPVTAQASVNPDDTVEIWYCCGANITATYDPGLGALSELTVEGLLHYEVIDHGYDHNGVVTVPHGHDLVFVHGRVASVLDLTLQPAPPVEEIELSDDYGRITFAQIVGPINLVQPPTDLPGASSLYSERVTGPDGTVYETQHLPTDGRDLSIQIFETTELGGTWQLEHLAAGPGIAFTEGIAYHVFDMQLPEGHLLGEHSEHVT